MGTAGFGGLKIISKVGMNDIVNTHFRYQLRNVEFKVGIFLYGTNYETESSKFKGKMLTRFYSFS